MSFLAAGGLAVLAGVVGDVSAQCIPEWSSGFELPGIAGQVNASILFDDGSGPKLYVGGSFHIAGGQRAGNVARWNGEQWERVGDAFFANPAPAGVLGSVRSLAIHNGELYAGGQFRRVGTTTVNNIAKWDGSAWIPLVAFGAPGVLSTGTTQLPAVNAMLSHNDGNGQALILTGFFTDASGTPLNSIAKWNGESFEALSVVGEGLRIGTAPGTGYSLAEYNGGFYVGGDFSAAAGVANSRGIARWTSAGWTSIGAIDGNSVVRALTVFDEDGNGPTAESLIVGGTLTTVGIGLGGSPGVPTHGVASFNGAGWTPLAQSLVQANGESSVDVLALAIHDAGSGPRLYAGGGAQFDENGPVTSLWTWNGTDWDHAAGGPARSLSAWSGGRLEAGGAIYSLLSADIDGAGPQPTTLVATGLFDGMGSTVAANIAQFTSGSWSSMPSGDAFWTSNASALNWLLPPVSLIAGDEDGAGPEVPAVYAYGNFVGAGDSFAVGSIVRHDGDEWVPLADGPGAPSAAALFHDDGTGSRLYTLRSYGYMDRWDGAAWSSVAAQEFIGATVRTAASFDEDGAGPNPASIFVGGFLHGQEGSPLGVGKWTGTSWITVSSANVPGAVNPTFDCQVLHPSGEYLYAGGSFETLDQSVTYGNALARWDGISWLIVGEANGLIKSMATFQGALYVGGQFTSIGGVSSPGLGKWDGAAWSDVGGGVTRSFPTARSYVLGLSVGDDGTGEALFVGGQFLTAGGVEGTRGVAKWTGTEFLPLNTGIALSNAVPSPAISIGTSATSVASVGGHVYFAGSFNQASGTTSWGIAKWGCEGAATCPADLDDDGSFGNGATPNGGVDINDLLYFLAGFEAGDVSVDLDDDGEPSVGVPDGGVDVNDLLFFLSRFEAGC